MLLRPANGLPVIPANAGTHFDLCIELIGASNLPDNITMDPGVRRDDGKKINYRRASANLLIFA
jgi:hypothetical protein